MIHIKIIFLSLAVLLFLSGCKTNPPNSFETDQFGRVYVTANITGADILVDNQNSGKVTPDTLTLSTGEHIIRLEKASYVSSEKVVSVEKNDLLTVEFTLIEEAFQKVVLIEDFANVSCNPCVISNRIIEQLTKETYGHSKLVAIKFPTNFPGPSDPFYLQNTAHSDARMAYYNILFAPTVIIDGISKPTATDSFAIKSAVDTRLLITPKFQIIISDTVVSNSYNIEISLNVLSTDGLDFNDLVLQTVITETDIEYASPPGSNGETKFYDIMRTMIPSPTGESVSSITQPGEYDFTRQYQIPSGINASDLNTVAFIQDNSSREIYQTSSTHK